MKPGFHGVQPSWNPGFMLFRLTPPENPGTRERYASAATSSLEMPSRYKIASR
jgi:hypothetical protein